ncbi:MAG TPA: DUF2786 domain-containing protein [Polyangiaceae bacterium]
MSAATETLGQELERAALYAIRRAWEDLNGTLFKWQLVPPRFELVDARARLGRFRSAERVLELSRVLLLEHGWGELVEVLKHEMAHQYVAELLLVSEEATHGPLFRKVCEERGIDARPTGIPAASEQGPAHAHVLERIAKLLALAESSNEHEAAAAMSAAQRMMLKYNLDLALSGGAPSYGFRHLGTPTGRVSEAQRILAGILSDHFFVETIWVPVWRPREGKRGSVLEVCGAPENLELAEYVRAFLLHTAERLFREYRRASGGRAGKRSTFVAGVMTGFRDRLERERKKSQREGLVWVGDAQLASFFKARHPRVRWTRHAVGHGSEAYARGREAGEKIIFHRGIRAKTGQGAVRLLPPAKS